MVGLRLPHEFTARVDQWAKKNGVTRSEAVRRLVDLGLAGTQPMRRRSPQSASKASELAGKQIDKLSDPSATDEERQTRQRRLLIGPGEFREMRGDIGSKLKS
jgi:Ribbon-helix-helix protein, copG family